VNVLNYMEKVKLAVKTKTEVSKILTFGIVVLTTATVLGFFSALAAVSLVSYNSSGSDFQIASVPSSPAADECYVYDEFGQKTFVACGTNFEKFIGPGIDFGELEKNKDISSEVINKFKSLPKGRQFELNKRLSLIKDNIEEKGLMWEANFNPKFILSDEQAKSLCGLKGTPPEKSRPVPEPVGDKFLYPDSFDWRDINGNNYITDIKDQGSSCGSCWAFAALSAFEGAINAYYNNPDIDADLSEQDLISCAVPDGCCGANSGEIGEMFSEFFVERRIPTEQEFEYQACDAINPPPSDCGSIDCDYAVPCSWQGDEYWLIEEGRLNIILSPYYFKNAIMSLGPIEVGMLVYDDFFSYSGGIYQHPDSDDWLGGHAVTLVGWGKEDGLEYWIVKNSWGEDWGEDGYFRIAMGNCSIESWFACGVFRPYSAGPQDIVCSDNDGDGYCYWGSSYGRPIECPASCLRQKDCDDAFFNDEDTINDQNCGKPTEPTGTLRIASSPGDAEVYVQDPKTGEWHYRGSIYSSLVIELNVGDREIKVAKEGYVTEIRTLTISENAQENLYLELHLAPDITNIFSNDVWRVGDFLEIKGIVPGPDLEYFVVEYKPDGGSSWLTGGITLTNGGTSEINEEGVIATWDTSGLAQDFYTLRLKAEYTGGEAIIEKKDIYFDPTLKEGWPVRLDFKLFEFTRPTYGAYYITRGDLENTIYDLDNDGFKELIFSNTASYEPGRDPERLPQGIMVFNHDGFLHCQTYAGDYEMDAGSNLRPPTVADIDNDGFGEIIFWRFYLESEFSELYVFDKDCNILPGWPITLHKMYAPGLSVFDLNNDGIKEIIIDSNYDCPGARNTKRENLFIINGLTGEIILEVDTPPELCGTDANCGGYPAIGNFDDDDDYEVVFVYESEHCGWPGNEGSNGSMISIYNMDGSLVDGWPIYVHTMFGVPVVGDIDSDGKDDIVIGSQIFAGGFDPDEGRGGLFAFDRYGNILPSFPFGEGYNFSRSVPALGDVNGDGFLEIAVERHKYPYEIYLIDSSADIMPGWPKQCHDDYSGGVYAVSMSDIDGDDIPEIIFSDSTGYHAPSEIYVWNSSGDDVAGFPKITERLPVAPITIDDIDGDGSLEMIASSCIDYDYTSGKYKFRSSIYVWELGSSYDPETMDWPTFQHDPAHTANYNFGRGISCIEQWSDQYQCAGDWRQRKYIHEDCSEEWLDYEFCDNGCYNGVCFEEPCQPHDADTSENWQIELSELSRLITFYNASGYHCDPSTLDGYAPFSGDQSCQPHDADTSENWQIELSELSRLITFYNASGYHCDPSTSDGYSANVGKGCFDTFGPAFIYEEPGESGSIIDIPQMVTDIWGDVCYFDPYTSSIATQYKLDGQKRAEFKDQCKAITNGQTAYVDSCTRVEGQTICQVQEGFCSSKEIGGIHVGNYLYECPLNCLNGACVDFALPEESLISHWSFDDGTANDQVGDNDGEIHGATPAAGKVGQGLSFDGGNDYVDFPGLGEQLNGKQELTIEFWMKPDGPRDYSIILGFGGSGYFRFSSYNTNHHSVTVFDSGIIAGTDQRLRCTPDYSHPEGCYHNFTDDWSHTVLTFNDSKWYWYINGELQRKGATGGAGLNATADMYIGRAPSSRFWRGILDEVKVYDRILSEDEVEFLYQSGLE